MLREAHDLYTQWQLQDKEGILKKSADTLEVILAGLKLHGLDQADLLHAREERLNMFGAFGQGRFLQGPRRETGLRSIDEAPAFLFAPDQADRLIDLIRNELDRSDQAWIASAFYSPGVINLLISNFIRFIEAGGQLSVLTSTMGNINRPEHLIHLRDTVPGIRVKVYHPPDIPLDQPPPNFHPKAYLFRHRDGKGALLIGSSNFTEAGFLKNIEWNYFSSDEVNLFLEGVSPFEAALRQFVRHWEQDALELTDDFLSVYRQQRPPDSGRRDRFVFESPAPEWSAPKVTPNSAQTEALWNLGRLREQGVKKASVIAATGVGKTHLAAFDYKATGANRLLFIAHRETILLKARDIFRSVLGNSGFGEVLGAGKGSSGDASAVFAMIQTLGREENLSRFASDSFDYLVVDEFHHGMAPTYLRAINHFRPSFLLGLTATPERMDGRDVLRLCDYNIAYEIRLLDAVDRGWLSPFQYFAIHDETDYRQIMWRGTHYDEEELTRALSNDTRTAIIAANLRKYLPSFGKIKALAFCSSVSHARYTARRLTEEHKIEAVALTGATPSETRLSTLQRLENESDSLEVICTVDIFNEGVDVPSLSHILLLRPTQSFTIFLQQLGRGLRNAPGKDFLVVIDFVGNFRKAYVAPLALSGYTSIQEFAADSAVTSKRTGPAYNLPKGCFLDPDIQVQRIWDREIRAILRGKISVEDRLKALYADIRADLDGTSPSLFDFLNNAYKIDPYIFIRHFGNWLRTRLVCEGALSKQERALLDTPGEAFLSHLESGLSPVKSYKMVVLMSLLDMSGESWDIDKIAARFHRFFMDHPDKRFDYDELAASPDPGHFPLSKVKAKLLQMPLHFLSNTEKDWFTLDKPGNTFSLKPELASYWNDPFFRDLIADRVRFALTRYFSRKAQSADISYTQDLLSTGFPVPRDFAIAFYAENPLKPGDSRRIKLDINGERHDALFQRLGPGREYRVVYNTESDLPHALREYAGDNLKPGEIAFTIKPGGKNELTVEEPAARVDLRGIVVDIPYTS